MAAWLCLEKFLLRRFQRAEFRISGALTGVQQEEPTSSIKNLLNALTTEGPSKAACFDN